ncbi:PepSY-associated TM helix domain-containing protein [Glacieibacterium sp.]|uniref:PepSY-associated TM helix domain-containing protein n=1 Tax=Glacieibacterium sp. TaxID=2860237 RepID=UPI003B00856E
MAFALPRLNQSGLLFVPKAWQRAKVINWLKKIHAWTGFWGALLFLMMGTSGFLLNHRTEKLKIVSGEPIEISAVDIAVKPGEIADADALGVWAKAALDLRAEGKAPRGRPGGEGPGGRGGRGREGGGAGGGEGGGAGGERHSFNGQAVAEPEKWVREFTMPDGKVTVSYVPGAPFVSAKRDSNGFFGTIKNFHKGVGLGVAWVLFLDTIAGALITMSITGFLLWSRLHGGRLLAGGIVVASFVVASSAIWPFI